MNDPVVVFLSLMVCLIGICIILMQIYSARKNSWTMQDEGAKMQMFLHQIALNTAPKVPDPKTIPPKASMRKKADVDSEGDEWIP